MDPEPTSNVLSCRKIPFYRRKEVQEERLRLKKRGVLQCVDDPTEWVSQMAAVEKPNRGLRICVYPQQPLNRPLKRKHFKLPTIDDVLPKLRQAKEFSELDVKERYLRVKLDDLWRI